MLFARVRIPPPKVLQLGEADLGALIEVFKKDSTRKPERE
jgi:hypothetical protein